MLGCSGTSDSLAAKGIPAAGDPAAKEFRAAFAVLQAQVGSQDSS